MLVAGRVDIAQAMEELSSSRPVFHSEADFQHALAWHVLLSAPDLDVRLERRLSGGRHLDVWVRDPVSRSTTALELKYLCAGLRVVVGDEEFELPHHGAQDIRGYDVIKDVTRIEELVSAGTVTDGAVIVLANDSSYWTRPTHGRTTGAAAFRLYEGDRIEGLREWGPRSAGTQRHRPEPLHVAGSHQVAWQNYSRPAEGKGGLFRWMMLDVDSPHHNQAVKGA